MYCLISSLIGFVFGSFPTAFLLLKKYKNLDITSEGSGNVGAMNALTVTKSKFIGIAVLLIDALKGLLSVYLVLLFLPIDFVYPAIALLFAVFSHCFNPWLKFKGGRGLATAAGGTALLFPFLLVLWLAVWAVSYLVKKDIIFANIWATVMSLVIVFSSDKLANKYAFPQPESTATLILFSTSLMLIIFVKHIDPLKDLINDKKLFSKKVKE
jgi:glycerol-3-phosphate acyltransferase PlsY